MTRSTPGQAVRLSATCRESAKTSLRRIFTSQCKVRLDAAKSLHVHLGWVVQTYNASEALANLIHPFWMLPLLGILGLKARDIIGYASLQFVVHVPLVLTLVWLLNYTLTP